MAALCIVTLQNVIDKTNGHQTDAITKHGMTVDDVCLKSLESGMSQIMKKTNQTIEECRISFVHDVQGDAPDNKQGGRGKM